MRWKLVGGLAVVALGSSLLFARQGTVTTKTGQVYKGDVTENAEGVEITGVAGETGPVLVRKANVDTVQYPDEVVAEIRRALVKIDRKDIKTRLNLAERAMQVGAYDLADEILEAAAKTDPTNRDVTERLRQLKALMPVKPPTTRPIAATRPLTPVTADETSKEAYVVKRPITPAEINRLKQLEWHMDDSDPVRVRIDPETRKKFLATNNDITASDFAALSAPQQAALILSKEKPSLAKGVILLSDPATLADFRKTVNRIVVQSCGSTNCHGSPKGGSFTLMAATNDAGVYTNFIVLQKYAKTVDKTEHFLIDRTFPDASLLLQYMLVPEIADTPHPKILAYKGAVKTKSDTRYDQVATWIRSLNPKLPDYKIDLSKEPPAEPPKGEAK